MTERVFESTVIVVLLLIYVIDASPRLLMRYRTSREIIQKICLSRTISKVIKRTSSLDIPPKETMMANDIRIKCRECDVWFQRLEWMRNKECDNPNCRCPEVAKVRATAIKAIEKAKESSKTNIINIKRNPISPTGYDAETAQYMCDVPDVMVVDVIVPKSGNRKRRN